MLPACHLPAGHPIPQLAARSYLEAALAGWRVVRLGPNELTTLHVERLVALVNAG